MITIEQLHGLFLQCECKLTTDSRSIQGGEIFVALKGENFDGNKFAFEALAAGAAYSVVNADSGFIRAAANSVPASRIIPVADTLKTLQQLASYHREHTLHDGRRIPMLALTGTNGKTTTKELIKCVLATKYQITATEGNFNNNLGVPLTLLRMTEDTQMAVVEMGASHPGDINELVDIAHPDFGLITNVGRAHLLGFGSFDGVKATKGEMYDYILKNGGKCFVNTGSSDLKEMAAGRHGLEVVEYGRNLQQATVLPMDREHPFLRLKFADGRELDTQLVGAYNADNVLAALAVGEYFGVDGEMAFNAISSYRPTNNRSQMQDTGRNILVVDAYNANPSSMAAALENFSLIRAEKKALMLGDMLELGAESDAEHRKVLDKACSIPGIQLIVLVGKEFHAAASNAASEAVRCFPTSDDAAAYLASNPLNGCTVLVKGSRGTKMEKLIPEL